MGQLAANVAAELNNLLNVVTVCSESVAGSPDITAAARLHLLALAGRVAHAIIDARRRGVSLRRWIPVNRTLARLDAAVQLLLGPGVEVAVDLDAGAGSVLLAPGELDLLIVNLVLDARARLGESGRVRIHSAREVRSDGEAVVVTVADQPFHTAPARADADARFGLATVRMITRDGAGEVQVHPTEGGGSEVSIRMLARPSQSD